MVFSVKRHKVINPKRKTKKRSTKRLFKRKARKSAKRSKKYSSKKRNSGGFITMATKKNRGSRKRRTKKRYSSKRRSNPFRASSRRHVRHHSRRRRNPGMGIGSSGLVSGVIGASAGAIGTRALTQALLGAKNTGVMGYAGNIGVGLALAWAANKFGGKNLSYAVLIGAGVGIVQRAWSENVSLASPSSLSGARGLGDLDYSATRFGRLGDYVSTPFFTPSNSVQIVGGAPNTFAVQSPIPAALPAPAAGHLSGHGRRFARAGRNAGYAM